MEECIELMSIDEDDDYSEPNILMTQANRTILEKASNLEVTLSDTK